ncbi:type VI secretion system baseplate subunit TssE [Vibrio sp. WXL103]|uniref:type VI secretion system baseplate subunit TssE n=1 Tax=unclassified Vibrio TaxID=2614977 RepID=UPI003EC7C83A
MDKGFRLLERIELGEPKSAHEKVTSSEELIRSIQSHLKELLNTHSGNTQLGADYGLPDFNDVLAESTNMVREIKRSIKQTIETYEPRIQTVQVNYIPSKINALQLTFSIVGEVVHNNQVLPLAFDISVDVDGKFNV